MVTASAGETARRARAASRLRARLGRLARSTTAPAVIGLAATAVVGALAYFAPPVLADVDLAVFDTFQQISPREGLGAESPVRVVLIDEASLTRVGQWPWPRTEIATLVERLTAAGAAAIAFDMAFAEPDRTSPERMAALWRERAPALADAIAAQKLPDNDAVLAEAFAAAPVVLGAFLTSDAADSGAAAPRFPASVSVQGSNPRAGLTGFAAVDGSLAALVAAASGVGSVSLAERRGDVVRTVPLVSRVGPAEGASALAPALSIEALRVAVGAPGYLLRATDASGELAGAAAARAASLRIGPFVAPLTPEGAIWVRYAARETEPEPISAWRLLAEGGVDAATAEAVAGRIVFVGGSAAGLRDIVATPLDPQIPGVMVHAQIVEQILGEQHLSRPDWLIGLEKAATVGLGLLVTLVFAFRAPLLAAGVTLLAVGGVGAASWLAFEGHGLLLGPLFPMLGALAPSMAAGFASYTLSDQERRAVRRQFQHFVPADVIEEISRDPDRFLTPQGETRDLTLLFADVRGFSRLSEGLAPDALIRLLNDVLTPISDAVLEEGGTIDKFMGDAMMAFWNAPRPLEDHAERALRAALAIRREVAALNTTLAAEGRGPIDIGVGLNSGPCSVGSMGSRRRLDYSCIGDTVNVASRLEGLTRQYGIGVCVGAGTAALAPEGAFALLEIDHVRVKGRDAPETIYALIGDRAAAASPEFAALARAFAAALAAYRAQDWTAARRLYGEAGALGEPGLAEAFLARIAQLEVAPPEAGWDGVWTATQK